MPSGFNSAQANKREQDDIPTNTLFDPSLYLLDLNKDEAPKTCARLSTYDWINPDIMEYDTEIDENQTEWFSDIKENFDWGSFNLEGKDNIKERINYCFQFQKSFGVEKYIIPVPLVQDIEDQFSLQLEWIDAAIDMKNIIDGDLYVSLPLLDEIFFHKDFNQNQLLHTIIDNISTNQEIDGVYVLVLQNRYHSFYETKKSIVEGLLEISYRIGFETDKDVIINFEDVFGLVCMGVGASGFGAGYYSKSKRLHLLDYKETGYGESYPTFYSHELINDLSVGDDLNKLKDSGLLRFINNDETESSFSLISALKNNESASSVPDWSENLNNIKEAKSHRIKLINKKTNEFIDNNTTLEEKVNWIRNWLLDAEINNTYLENRFRNDPLDIDSKHVYLWRAVFDEFINKHSIL